MAGGRPDWQGSIGVLACPDGG